MSDDKTDSGRDPKTGQFLPGNKPVNWPQPDEIRSKGWWKPGQSGNPGGMTKETKRLQMQSAEAAARLRDRMLRALEKKIGAGEEMDEATMTAALAAFTPEVLRMLKDAEDRGFGAPTQTVEVREENLSDAELIARMIDDGVDVTVLRAVGVKVPLHLLPGGGEH